MKFSGKITRFLAGAAILSMLATPALAGKGNGPGDGTGTGERDGEYCPNDCDLSSVEFTMSDPLLLAGDQTRDRDKDGDCDGDKDQSRDQDKDCQS
jgi:hypothetical protein